MLTTILILLVIIFFAKNIFSEFINNENNPLDSSIDKESTVVEGKFTPKTLTKYNGKDSPKIFIAVKNRVFDVTQGAAFYGPGGPYENFAGRDASRGLAKNSFDEAMLTDINKPIDKLEDLTKLEIESLDGWEEHFENRYKVVGTLHENGTIKEEQEDVKEE
ncbi:DAP1 Damage response protein 1 [Candida maltosa Xu316]|uniref:DNA damage response protein, putative n=1 Tax=Candida maltosa (strain Xu316) TaxID=1245528 RepID=M3K1T1_CANMX|nr:DNA damage response protein, putative [Candida maltosa Xu316]